MIGKNSNLNPSSMYNELITSQLAVIHWLYIITPRKNKAFVYNIICNNS
jgi:hypothetical protein